MVAELVVRIWKVAIEAKTFAQLLGGAGNHRGRSAAQQEVTPSTSRTAAEAVTTGQALVGEELRARKRLRWPELERVELKPFNHQCDLHENSFTWATSDLPHAGGAARRRRERQLSAWPRHERMTVALVLVEMLHHAAAQP